MRPGENHIADPALAHLEPLFSRWKRAEGVLELDDLVPLALELLESPAGESFRRGLEFVLIDEFQDIDDLQHRMFERLLGPRTGFSLFGDDDQAIYRWRGSNPDLIRSYARRKDVRTHLLATNYRCRASILALASRVVEGDEKRVAKPAIAFRKGGVRPRCVAGSGQPERVAGVLERLHAEGRPLDALAVLVRDHFDGRLVRRAAHRRGIPVTGSLEGKGVRLLTLHGSKGLEFPVVLLPFLDHLRFPNRRLLARETAALKARRRRARKARREEAWLRVRLGLAERAESGAGEESGGATRYGPLAWMAWLEAALWRALGEHRLARHQHELTLRFEEAQKEAAWLPALDAAWRRLPLERQERLAEERRLCYVAMTRAQDELWLFCEDWDHRSEFLRAVPRRLLEKRVGEHLGD